MSEIAENTKARIFDKLDEVKDEMHDVSERLARVEENQKSHHKDHDVLNSSLSELKASVDGAVERIDEVEAVLDKREGEHGVYFNIWHLVLAVVGSGILVTVGGIIAKAIGIFG